VWKTDPYGTLEQTLYRFLKLSPYRCARCDRRFMDSKIPAPDTSPALMRRWLSRASRLLHRTPLDEALQKYSILGPPPAPNRRATQQWSDRSQPNGMEPAGLGEKSGLRA
jgi:hypothetical protein